MSCQLLRVESGETKPFLIVWTGRYFTQFIKERLLYLRRDNNMFGCGVIVFLDAHTPHRPFQPSILPSHLVLDDFIHQDVLL
jgi:hypothetical protein